MLAQALRLCNKLVKSHDLGKSAALQEGISRFAMLLILSGHGIAAAPKKNFGAAMVVLRKPRCPTLHGDRRRASDFLKPAQNLVASRKFWADKRKWRHNKTVALPPTKTRLCGTASRKLTACIAGEFTMTTKRSAFECDRPLGCIPDFPVPKGCEHYNKLNRRLEGKLLHAFANNYFDFPVVEKDDALALVNWLHEHSVTYRDMARFANVTETGFSHWRRGTSKRLTEQNNIIEAFNRGYYNYLLCEEMK